MIFLIYFFFIHNTLKQQSPSSFSKFGADRLLCLLLTIRQARNLVELFSDHFIFLAVSWNNLDHVLMNLSLYLVIVVIS